MLEYDRVDISEGVNVNKTNALKNVIFVIIDILKILVLSMSISLQWLSWFNAKSFLMMLLLFMLKEVFTEFIFDIWAKMLQLA